MTDELVKGIRRIVGDQDEKPTGLPEAELRKAIGISRGVAFIGSGGAISGGGGEGAGNDTAPPVVPDPEADTGSPPPGDEGKIGTGTDAGGKTVVSGDVADVDDATVGGVKVGEVTGTDPTTANYTTVNFDSLAGIEYTPPDGWLTPEDGPPVDSTGVTPSCANMGCPTPVALGSFIRKWNSVDGKVYEQLYDNDNVGGTASPLYPSVGINNCISCPNINGRFPGLYRSTEVFLEAPASETEYPVDSTCAVVYDYEAGGYKGHTLDPDCSAAQKTATDFVIIRSQTQPSRYFRYTKLADGGTKVTEVDSGGTPLPGSITKLLDAGGNAVGFVDVSLDPFYT